MLRRCNPGLAAKVRLDDKGKLKVFNAKEARREWETGYRRSKTGRRSRHRRRGDEKRVGGLHVLHVPPAEQVWKNYLFGGVESFGGWGTGGGRGGGNLPREGYDPNGYNCNGEQG